MLPDIGSDYGSNYEDRFVLLVYTVEKCNTLTL